MRVNQPISQQLEQIGSCDSLRELFETMNKLSKPAVPSTSSIYELGNCFLEVVTDQNADWAGEVLRICESLGIECAPRILEIVPVGTVGSSVVAYQYDGMEKLQEAPTLYAVSEGLKKISDKEMIQEMIDEMRRDMNKLVFKGLIHPHASESIAHWKVILEPKPRFILENWYSVEQASPSDQKHFIEKMNSVIDRFIKPLM